MAFVGQYCLRTTAPFFRQSLIVGRAPILTSLSPWSTVMGTYRWAGSFFQNQKSSDLWKAVTSVSNQGRMRGRAKGIIKKKNLNRGQLLGMGEARISFPGLTKPVLDKNRKKQSVSQLSETEFKEYEDGLKELRALTGTKRSRLRKQLPLERGWTGSSPQGKNFGPPLSTSTEGTFENFDSVLIEYRTMIKMTGTFGRTRSLKMIIVTGNRNGSAGFASTRVATGRGPKAFQKAVNKAGLRLCYIPRYEDRTVYHNFFTAFGQTRIFVQQKPPGYGVEAQRVIKSICDIIGIKDLYAKIEGSHNYDHIVKAFFLGLLRQRTHQELANEKQLHLVEFREENDNFPRVVASPEDGKVRKREDIRPNEFLDFEMISYDGNLPYLKAEPAPFYEKLPSWQNHLKKVKPQEHHYQQRIDMLVEQGKVASHLTGIFPECVEVGRLTNKRFIAMEKEKAAAVARSGDE